VHPIEGYHFAGCSTVCKLKKKLLKWNKENTPSLVLNA
jgi:hypothetical protein